VKLLLALAVASLLIGALWARAREPEHSPPVPMAARLLPPTSPDMLASVALSEEARAALGIELAVVEVVSARSGLVVSGEVMVPAGRDVVLTAPISGRIAGSASFPRAGEPVRAGQVLLVLHPIVAVDRNARAAAKRDLEAARANLELTESRLRRASSLLGAGSGSQRSLEEAQAQRQIARAEVQAGEARLATIAAGPLEADTVLSIRSPVDGVLRAVRVAQGQTVPAGTSLVDVAGTGRWVRVSLSPGDARAAGMEEAHARRIGSEDAAPLVSVLAPPSADPQRGTVDRFFMLPQGSDWIPGERVLVQLLGASRVDAASIPSTAVVRDAEGAAWVYEQTGPDSFRRRRIEPIRRDGDRLLIARGLAPSNRVVSVGVVELWGFELGADR
jgi:RND family efflux transporter MFP subunit